VPTDSTKEEYLGAALGAICELMCWYGISKPSAEVLVRKALDGGFSSRLSVKNETSRITRLADVCARWHFEKDFLNADGRPKPLRWNGRAGSLLKLVTRVAGAKESREVIEELISRKLVIKDRKGAWIPKSKVVPPVGLASAQVMRCATMIERMARTVIYNSELSYKGDVLLEVMAQVPRLPVRDIKSFRRFAKAQGVSFIKTVDDWLESRNLRRSRSAQSAREAGVVAFAFVEPRKRRRKR
jgi:hypothetical protein